MLIRTWAGASVDDTSDIVLLKYNSSGSLQWIQQIGTSSTSIDDVGLGVAVSLSDEVYVTGCTEGVLEGQTNQGKHTAHESITYANR